MKSEVDLVVIGNTAYETAVTAFGTETSRGGAAYYTSVAAASYSSRVGVVTRVGGDFPLTSFAQRMINSEGVQVFPEAKTSRFRVRYLDDGTSEFSIEEVGVLGPVDTAIFPPGYKNAPLIHLATSHPQDQLDWLEFLREISPNSTLSADLFALYIKENLPLSLEVIKGADILFLNEQEHCLLQERGFKHFPQPVILKKGPQGATYQDQGQQFCSQAPRVRAVDTTGAGDVLAGSFLALRLASFCPSDALARAVQTASCSVTEFGVEHL